MKDKKGLADAVDWILGVGLFIISITFIFILFRPGVTPVYDSETLLNILQEGFEENLYWDITETPIFITPLYSEYYDNSGNVFLDDKGYNIMHHDGTTSSGPAGNFYDKLSDLIGSREETKIKVFYVI